MHPATNGLYWRYSVPRISGATVDEVEPNFPVAGTRQDRKSRASLRMSALAEDARCTIVCSRSPTAALRLHCSDRILVLRGRGLLFLYRAGAQLRGFWNNNRGGELPRIGAGFRENNSNHGFCAVIPAEAVDGLAATPCGR